MFLIIIGAGWFIKFLTITALQINVASALMISKNNVNLKNLLSLIENNVNKSYFKFKTHYIQYFQLFLTFSSIIY